MKITSENLVIVTRKIETLDAEEVLVGRKKRGRFADFDIFPGGKAEGTTSQPKEAARELWEETGIRVAPRTLHALGNLVIYDMRPGIERFGNVHLYGVTVDANTKAVETDELKNRWQAIDDPKLTDRMPPDVAFWLPAVRQPGEALITTHIIYGEGGTLDVIVKHPDFAHTSGKIIQQATLSPQV